MKNDSAFWIFLVVSLFALYFWGIFVGFNSENNRWMDACADECQPFAADVDATTDDHVCRCMTLDTAAP